ncbi:MAG: hypothetical protein XU11_C0048G0002 [Candidatus Dadabacteria bacterium CSP1-2]|jgi:hypothetical protein|nr:MAG: hypothetical protein XU11_C0048G0002 [Candidatus Dadabacteria bacterium CSP1-2]
MNKISSRTFLTALLIGALFIVTFIAGRVTADQPHMRAALSSLQVAQSELQQAVPDKGGHRVRALELVNQAIVEVQAGIEFAEY